MLQFCISRVVWEKRNHNEGPVEPPLLQDCRSFRPHVAALLFKNQYDRSHQYDSQAARRLSLGRWVPHCLSGNDIVSWLLETSEELLETSKDRMLLAHLKGTAG